MNTKKLYYDDCHLEKFSATVLSCEQVEKGYEVILDATAFYPEGGGQASDIGFLGDVQVLHCKEEHDAIIHLCNGPLTVGKTVEGQINYAHRFDLMQQHTGEHILSGIIHEKYGYHNTGFHVSSDTVTVDFDGMIPPEEILDLELSANMVVWENRPVRCGYPSPEELPTIPYRSKRELPWPVRIVEVPGTDICACCGVHVAYTGEVGCIKILSCIKFHQGVRMEMVCGSRAFRWYHNVYEQNRLVSQAFSAKVLETGAAAQKMNEMLAAEKFRANNLQKQVFDAMANRYQGTKNPVHFEADLAPGSVRELADCSAKVCIGTATVYSGNDTDGYTICLIGSDAKELGAKAASALNGRGGGKPGSFQGSLKATRNEIVEHFK